MCRLSLGQRGGEPGKHHLQWDAARQVLLKIEEDLSPPHAGAGRPGQVRGGQLVEVGLGAEHRNVAVVQIQERLQAGELVLGPELIGVGAGQRDPVAPGQPDEQLGFERALDVNMKLRCRQHAHPSGFLAPHLTTHPDHHASRCKPIPADTTGEKLTAIML